MTSPSDRSVRPLSSTEGGAADIAGQGGIGQAEVTKGDGTNGEMEEQEEDVAARDPRVARRPIKPQRRWFSRMSSTMLTTAISVITAELVKECHTNTDHQKIPAEEENSA